MNFEIEINQEIPENHLNFEKSYKINRNSDENNLYMKNDQKNMKNPNMPPTYLPHPFNMMNMKLSPLIHLTDNWPELVKHLQMFPAPTNLRSAALEHP